MKHVLKMVLEKETAGALRFAELSDKGKPVAIADEGTVVGVLYVRKAAYPAKSRPKTITVTIES